MSQTCPPARSPSRFNGAGVSLCLVVLLAGLGCGGVEEPERSIPHASSPVLDTAQPPDKPHEPPASQPYSGPPRGGFVVVTGDDADDLWHCEYNRCGGLYPSLFREALSRSKSGGVGILAIGVNQGQALATFNSWNDSRYGGPAASVTHVRSLTDISRVDFARFALVYLPSAERHTRGGLSDEQIASLNTRQADLAHFVNVRGGSLIALTQAEVPGGWGFLPMPLTTEDTSFDIAAPTDELREFAPAITTFELSHKSFHNVFTGPSGYSGLHVLAYNDERYHEHLGKPVMLGGTAVILSAEVCGDGIDNDGDGHVDGEDSDCEVCGNGTVDSGESCDDGNRTDGDGCSASCLVENPCGNGTVDSGESCDDGNHADGDGCSASCQRENRAPVVTCEDVSVCTDPGVCSATVSSSALATASDPDEDALSWDLHPDGPYAPGEHGVCVTASDGRAHDSCWSHVSVRDCEAPTLVCPADLRVECSGQGQALVTPPPAEATDNCGPATVQAPEAVSLPLGSHTLGYSAVDAAGNASTCAPTVTVEDTRPPLLVCPESITTECSGRSSAYVVPGVATAVDVCTAAQVEGPAPGWYPLGSTPVSYTARDGSGNEASCTSTIEVVDQTAPVVTVTPPEPLWPADAEYRTVRLEDCIVVHDQCGGGLTETGASASLTCVSSDEPQDGDLGPDIVFLDATTVNVRAARRGDGDGRVYTLHFEVKDAAGNVTRGMCPVSVPYDRNGGGARDSGEVWRACLPVGNVAAEPLGALR